MFVPILAFLCVSCIFREHQKEFILDLLEKAGNAYETTNLRSILFVFRNQNGLKIKVFRGHKSVILAFKGTSLSFFGYQQDHSAKTDKKVDNLIFSCCNDDNCYYKKRKKIKKTSYIEDSIRLVNQIRVLFPSDKIILTGHSLGGSMASIIARILGYPAFVFSSPGEKYYSDNITSTDDSKIFHFGACNDPVYMGICNGQLSICNLMGFKIQTRCHSGKKFCFGTFNFPTILMHKIDILSQIIKLSNDLQSIEQSECIDCSY